MALAALRQSGERMVYRVAGLPLAVGTPDDSLHQVFARRYWRPRAPLEWAELVAALVLWPVALLAASAFFTARNGPVIRRRTGKSVAAQLREQLSLYFSDGVLAPWYYIF